MKQTLLFLLLFLSLANCVDANDSDSYEIQEVLEEAYKPIENTRVINKAIFEKAYDAITHKCISLVINRNFTVEKRPDINNTPIERLKTVINGEAAEDRIIRGYIDTLLKKKTDLIALDSFFDSKVLFVHQMEEISCWPFIHTQIIKKEKDSIENRALIASIDAIVLQATSEFRNPKKRDQDKESRGITVKPEDSIWSKISVFIDNHARWWFYVLLVSVILHILLYVYYQKRIQKTKNQKPQSSESVKKQSDISTNTLDKTEIKNLLEQKYTEISERWSYDHSKECIDSIPSFDLEKNRILERIFQKKFTSKTDASKAIDIEITSVKNTSETYLNGCLDNKTARDIVHQKINPHEIIGAQHLGTLSPEDIQSKIVIQKNELLDTLPNIINQDDLYKQIAQLHNQINVIIKQMIAESLVFYLPFADSRGFFQDAKKSSSIRTESAVKLYVNPEDTTKASFHFLLDNPMVVKNAIMSYDVLLLPLCNLANNDFNERSSQLKQVGPNGTLLLVDGEWRVDQKLTIDII